MPNVASLAIAGLLAAADEPTPTIDWQAPAECPDSAEVTAMTTALLRSRSASPAGLAVRAAVTRVDGRFRVELALTSAHGHVQRTLESESCVLLARAVALVVAVHLDPVRVSQSLAPSPPPLPPPAAPGASVEPDVSLPWEVRTAPRVAAVDEERAPGLARRTDLSPPRVPPGERGGLLRVAGGVGYGVVPALAGEVALLGGAWGPRWRVEVGFAAAPGRQVLVQGVGGRVARLTATLRGCAVWHVRADRGSLLACLGGEFGTLGAVGTRGVEVPERRWSPWVAVVVGPAARVRLGARLGLWIGVDVVVPLTRPTFTVGASAQTLFEVPPAGVRTLVGLDVQIAARKRRVRATE